MKEEIPRATRKGSSHDLDLQDFEHAQKSTEPWPHRQLALQAPLDREFVSESPLFEKNITERDSFDMINGQLCILEIAGGM